MMNRVITAQALVALAVVIGALSIGNLVDPGSWFWPTVLAVGAALGTCGYLRTRTELISTPAVCGLVVGGIVPVIAYAPPTITANPLTWLSIPGEMFDLLRQGAEDATQRAPVLGSDGLGLMVCAATLLVFVLAELLAVGCRAPVWSGIALLIVWTPAAALSAHVPLWVFAGSAASFVGLLVVSNLSNAPTASRRRAARSAVIVSASTVVLALIIAPAILLIPVSQWNLSGGGIGGGGAGSTTRLDLGLDVRDQLRRGPESEIFSYTTDIPDLGPLHAYTVTDFDGSQWHTDEAADDSEEPQAVEQSQTLWPDESFGDSIGSVQINIPELEQDRLLVPGHPRQLDVQGEWVYAAGRDEIIGSGPSPLTYTVQVLERDIDSSVLNGADNSDAAERVDPEALAVPDTGHAEQIEGVAQRVSDAAEAETDYERAVAIQNYLRSSSDFTYDVDVDPPQTDDAVWDFLGSGRGYCVQFATAMVIMARTMDIPARMAVGFLEGTPGADGTYQVTGHRAHTWPQLYFEGTGWVRFEPTPATQSGAVPDWAAGVGAESADTPSEVPEGQTIEEPQTAPETQDTGAQQDEGTTGQGEHSSSSFAFWLAGLAVLVAVGLGLLWWRYRTRRFSDIDAAWARVTGALRSAGIAKDEASLTPTRVASGMDLGEESDRALRDLAHAVQAHRYARPDTAGVQGSDIRQWQQAAMRGIRRSARRTKDGGS